MVDCYIEQRRQEEGSDGLYTSLQMVTVPPNMGLTFPDLAQRRVDRLKHENSINETTDDQWTQWESQSEN